MVIITVNGRKINVHESTSMSHARSEAGMSFFGCGGRGRCGKCKVRLISGSAGVTSAERKHLTAAELRAGVRLACMLPAIDGMALEFDEAAPAQIAAAAEIHAVTPGRTGYGLAVDIGTTTLAIYLVNFETGEILETRSALNRQKAFGDDVITRISYTMENPGGTETMRETIIGQLNEMLAEFAAYEISSTVIAGNTIMAHFLLGVSAAGIAAAPFTPAFTEMIVANAEKLSLAVSPSAVITVLPAISGYVGGDVVAGIMCTGLHKSEKLKLLIDLGTNGEIVLGNKDKICCCAVAAGPAFEGGHLSCGTGGVAGAVDSFRIEDGKPVYTTISGVPATGICGSGVIDAVSALVAEGIIDETGFLEESPYYITDNVYITARDVREVQLAKSAVAAGIQCLLEYYGADVTDVDEVYIAGGFGSYMRAESALGIKMLPDAFAGRIRGAGNTSAGGALALLCAGDANTAEEIKAKTEYLELSCHAPFSERFITEMYF